MIFYILIFVNLFIIVLRILFRKCVQVVDAVLPPEEWLLVSASCESRLASGCSTGRLGEAASEVVTVCIAVNQPQGNADLVEVVLIRTIPKESSEKKHEHRKEENISIATSMLDARVGSGKDLSGRRNSPETEIRVRLRDASRTLGVGGFGGVVLGFYAALGRTGGAAPPAIAAIARAREICSATSVKITASRSKLFVA